MAGVRRNYGYTYAVDLSRGTHHAISEMVRSRMPIEWVAIAHLNTEHASAQIQSCGRLSCTSFEMSLRFASKAFEQAGHIGSSIL